MQFSFIFAIFALFVATAVRAEIELTYFGIKGRGEAIRLILHYANVPFKDTRLNSTEWLKVKGDKSRFPYAVMPVLRVGQHLIAETPVITRFVARMTRLDYGYDVFEQARLDEIYTVGYEFYGKIIIYLSISAGAIPGDKDNEYKTNVVPAVQKYMPLIEEHLKSSQNGFFSPRGLSYVDLFWASVIDWMNDIMPNDLKPYQASIELKNKVLALPQLQEYLRSRDEK
ncbi:unnamed protein product [Bursaphelenchus xylophilus]|uniref:glutathione transferase n=1 Tax=Bursaphelenchus xylophilus TaxID=6326 RepID=A0A7I8X8U8_BURXY|nr:unnamed protein product [Bursaphelenchus xylophilus]CAG9118733.1 unnamed protein product [Bursaphelenchus xylophilus]